LYTIIYIVLFYTIDMKRTLRKEFFGADADFFIGNFVKISHIKKLDRKSSGIEITFESIIKDQQSKINDHCPLCYKKLDGIKQHGSWCK